MRPDAIVSLAPIVVEDTSLEDRVLEDMSLEDRVEDLAGEEFVASLAVSAET